MGENIGSVRANAMKFILSLLALVPTTTNAYVPSHFKASRNDLSTGRGGKPIRAATVDGSTTMKPNGSVEPTSWDCNDEAECVVVPACDDQQCRTSLDVRIHGEWYDLTGE